MENYASDKRLYIAYGSNMNTAQMARRCPGAEIVAIRTLWDWELQFRGTPYGAHATIMKKKGASVPVIIWRISSRNEAMLDRYEGVSGGYYNKEYLKVENETGNTEKALVYTMRKGMPYNIPTESYYDGIEQAYLDAELNPAPLAAALKTAMQSAGRIRKAV